MMDVNEKLSALQDIEREELERAFRGVFATADGKRVLFWMLEQCAMYESAYAGENTNATNFLLGRQDVGKRVIKRLDEIDPRIYPQLLLDIADIKAMDQAALNKRAGNVEIEDEE